MALLLPQSSQLIPGKCDNMGVKMLEMRCVGWWLDGWKLGQLPSPTCRGCIYDCLFFAMRDARLTTIIPFPRRAME